jgi:hypothetical protein
MSATDKIFFSVFVFAGLVAGICIGYGVAEARWRVVDKKHRDYIATLERDHQLAIDAATDYREQLNRAGELAGQLADGLSGAIARASKSANYRAGAQIYIDAIREVGRGLGVIAGAGAVENTEPAPLADSE